MVILQFRLLKALIRTKKITKAVISAVNVTAAAWQEASMLAAPLPKKILSKYEDGILSLSIPKKDPKAVEAKKYIAIEGK